MLKKILPFVALVCALVWTGCDGIAEYWEKPNTNTPDTVLTPATYLTHYIPAPAPDFSLYRTNIEAKGIYITSNIAGLGGAFKERLAMIERTELNTVVIDVKADEGYITFRGKIPLADELGIAVNNIPDFDGLMKTLAEREIYTIARLVVFKDDTIVNIRPDFAIGVTDGSNGGIYRQRDGNNIYGTAWLNPYNRDVWEYTVELALQIAALGFDEIQFDYVRFPTDRTMQVADFGDTGGLSRIEILTEFSKYAYARISPTGVKLSADIFGTVINSALDASLIGQDLVELAKIYDVVCPMVYPSHYVNGAMGIEHPDLSPYDVIYRSMAITLAQLKTIPAGEHVAIVRPWLQDFTATWVNPHQVYGGTQLREQIEACYDAGLTEWLLWNARNEYSEEGLLPAEKE